MENIKSSARSSFNSAKNSLRQSVENISKTPIGNMINEGSFSMDNSSEERFEIVKKILFWVFVILILAFLGFNIFKYLAEGTDIVTALLSPFTSFLVLITGDTAKTTIQNTSEGTQKIVTESSNFLQVFLKFLSDIFNNSIDFVSNTSTSAIDYLQSNIKKDKITNEKGLTKEDNKKTNLKQEKNNDNEVNNDNELKNDNEETEKELDNVEEDLLNNERKIEKRVEDVPNDIKKLIFKKEENEPEPSQSDSQQHGFCYIGNLNNSRYCAKVTSKNKCMSGDIFPSMDICINPSLRS